MAKIVPVMPGSTLRVPKKGGGYKMVSFADFEIMLARMEALKEPATVTDGSETLPPPVLVLDPEADIESTARTLAQGVKEGAMVACADLVPLFAPQSKVGSILKEELAADAEAGGDE